MREVFNSHAPVRWTGAPVTAILVTLGGLSELWAAIEAAAGPGGSRLSLSRFEIPASCWPRFWASALELKWAALEAGEWWRLFTFPLCPQTGWGSLGVLSLLALLGRCVEPLLGPARLGLLLFLSLPAGGLLDTWMGSLHLPGFGTHGLRGWPCALFALLGAYGSVIPDWPVGAATRWPLPGVRARHIPRLALALALLAGLTGLGESAGPAALAGACAIGWALPRLFGFGEFPKRPDAPGPFLRRFGRSTLSHLESMDWATFVTQELDPVLEKIATRGLGSLTRAERRILKEGQRRLQQGEPDG